MDASLKLEPLSPVGPNFFVSGLSEKPQNPIVRTLKVIEANKRSQTPISSLPTELVSFVHETQSSEEPSLSPLWTNALSLRGEPDHALFSWDALRKSHSAEAAFSPFLSEQSDDVFSAARYILNPPLTDPSLVRVHVTHAELLFSLRLLIVGMSSPLFKWSSEHAAFIPRQSSESKEAIILLDGKDDNISQSLLTRFVLIGTIIRRIDGALARILARTDTGPIHHAFVHAVSVVLAYFREVLPKYLSGNRANLQSVWLEYEVQHDILVSLTTILGCEYGTPCKPDGHLPSLSPEELLSVIFDILSSGFELRAPSAKNAIFAYILSCTSESYIRDLCESIGMVASKPGQAFDRDTLDLPGLRGDYQPLNFSKTHEFPNFLPAGLVEALQAAQKSLHLLRQARQDHALANPTEDASVSWFWSHEAIMAAWHGNPPYVSYSATHCAARQGRSSSDNAARYKRGLEAFRTFDMEPGEDVRLASNNLASSGAVEFLHQFVATFPTMLPSVTSNMKELSALVFTPLREKSALISSELLSTFLSQRATPNLRLQLELLRSYMLVCSPTFKSRLALALFSDAEDPNSATSRSAYVFSQRGRPHSASEVTINGKWPVGLSTALYTQEAWPPNGADLSFFLRTVIVGSNEAQLVDSDDKRYSQRTQYLTEAETRLGFAVRDLSTEPGFNGWLNACSTEAFDFLVMDYKPPRPLHVLITPDVLSKYQRLFTFILRVMRAESALSSVFRMIRLAATPLFPTLTQTSKLLMHFRYLASSFVAALSSHIFDTAIGGNFDAFLNKLNPVDADSSRTDNGFHDVFALAYGHSAMLDDILSACLLRSTQQGAGDLLQQILEVILEFAVVVGDRRRNRIREYEASVLVNQLFKTFSLKLAILTKNLKVMSEKYVNTFTSFAGPSASKQAPGGEEALHHLLTRIDLTVVH